MRSSSGLRRLIWPAVLTLLAWGLRLVLLEEVPPGWRDDELINIYALAGRVLAGHPTLYFTGASGHEPLYHTAHAVVLALVGTNPLGAHLLSIASGTLTVPLLYALGRRLFHRKAAILAAVFLAPSFWSLMYSRFGMRHVTVLPPVLAAFCLLWSLDRFSLPAPRRRVLVACGLLLAAALYTYTVARLLPFVLLAFGTYLALFHRERFRDWWRPLLVTLLVMGVVTLPLWIAIAQGRSEAAAQGIGADARIAELLVPLREMRAGNPQPLLENVWTTLGMFHATGDPEWLYNLPARPVFGTVGAALFFAGLGLCVSRWRRPEYAFLLIWLAAGVSPALVTLPPSSLGHTILAQPAVYLITAIPLAAGSSLIVSRLSQFTTRRLSLVACGLLIAALSLPVIFRDLHDYFVDWPARWMVRFLYRQDYREAAWFLDEHPEVADIAAGSTLMGPWDRLALAADLRRDDLRARLFNPERALVIPAGSAPSVLLTTFPELDPSLKDLLEDPPVWEKRGLRLHQPAPDPVRPTVRLSTTFNNGLELVGATWPEGEPAPGRKGTVWLIWRVAR
ncbi:MAG: glycosyltransferase family 39 protein, partial [Anaerolineae bacterium]